MADTPHWHHLTLDTAARTLEVNPACGLDATEVAARLARHGPNRPRQAPGRSTLARFATQFIAPLVLVLIAAGGITAALGEWVDTAVIFSVVVINAVIGYVQEGKAEARTVAIEMAYLFNCRSLRLPIAAVAAFSNPWVWWGTGLMLALQLALTYWLPLAAFFGTAPIDARAWAEITAVALATIIIVELEKRWQTTRPK